MRGLVDTSRGAKGWPAHRVPPLEVLMTIHIFFTCLMLLITSLTDEPILTHLGKPTAPSIPQWPPIQVCFLNDKV